jgi:hypothetical protein
MVAGGILWEITDTSADGTMSENLLTGLAFLSFPAMGALIASRRPANAIGWLLLGIGFAASLLIESMGYAVYGLVTNEQGAPGATLAAWFVAWLWFPLITVIPTWLPLLFPTGKLPSRRWRPVAWLNASVLVIVTLPAMVEGRLAEGDYDIPNPIGIASLGDTEDQVFSIMGPVLLLAIALSLASLIVRYRKGSIQERQQLKWIAFAVGVLFVLTIFEEGFNLVVPAWIFPLSLMSIPVSMAIAVLRYRLYAIDRIISRTLAYGLLTAILAGAYFLSVLILQSLLPVTEDSPLIVAVSTLAVAAAFGPLRARIRSVMDHRFNRSRYDANRTIEDFGARLRNQTDLDSLSSDLVTVAHHTLQPTAVSLWLKEDTGDRG